MLPESGDAAILSALQDVSVYFKNGRVFLNDRDVSDKIRTPEAGHDASVYSALKPVRDFLLQIQRDAGLRNDIVAEGRDMTTVVFPGAWRKFYLDASEEGRARRRFLQLKEQGITVTLEEAIKDVRDRDVRDSQREIAPLKRADDAVYIDTTHMSLDEVASAILKNCSL
jgi:cytidylate kinase